MIDNINLTLHNRLWAHYDNLKVYLPTVCVDKVQWFKNGKSTLIIKGYFLKDKFLLDIHERKLVAFEILTGKCGDPSDYEQGKRLMIAKNPVPITWWTDDVMSMEENNATHICCQFACDWVEICD